MRHVAEKLAGTCAVATVNTEENRMLAGRFGVRGIPVLFLLKNGRKVDEISGAQSAEAVISWFQRHV